MLFLLESFLSVISVFLAFLYLSNAVRTRASEYFRNKSSLALMSFIGEAGTALAFKKFLAWNKVPLPMLDYIGYAK